LRAWRDDVGDLHIAANPTGAQRLARAIESLSGPHASNWVRLAADGSSLGAADGAAQSRRTFTKVQLEAADTTSKTWSVSATDLNDGTLKIRLGPGSVPVVLEACHRMASGGGEFSLNSLDHLRHDFDVFGRTASVWLSGDPDQ